MTEKNDFPIYTKPKILQISAWGKNHITIS